MRNTLCLALVCCLATGSAYAVGKKGDELTDPIEILKKVDAAARAVKSAKYKATYAGEGAAKARTPIVEGSVVLFGWSGGAPEKYRVDAKVKRPGSSEETRLTMGTDGEDFYVIDHAKKMAYVDIDPAVFGTTGRPATSLWVAEFVHPSPFSDELNGRKQELRGSKVIGGEDCYEVLVEYSGPQKAVWHFSKKDFLPRARRDMFQMPDGESGARRRIITDLVIDPKINESFFKFKLPEGYEQTDDFAP